MAEHFYSQKITSNFKYMIKSMYTPVYSIYSECHNAPRTPSTITYIKLYLFPGLDYVYYMLEQARNIVITVYHSLYKEKLCVCKSQADLHSKDRGYICPGLVSVSMIYSYRFLNGILWIIILGILTLNLRLLYVKYRYSKLIGHLDTWSCDLQLWCIVTQNTILTS